MQVVILAGEREGGDPLARAQGVSSKALLMIAGKPMLRHVLDAFAPVDAVAGITLCSHPITGFAGPWLAPGRSPCASAIAALDKLGTPLLMTTADHPLLTPAILDQFLARAALQADADICVGMVPLTHILARYPQARRTRLRFKGGSISGANLFLLRTPKARGLLDFWQRLEAHRKSPWRMARILGLASIARYALGVMTLDHLAALLYARTGARIATILLDDPHAAIDVDTAEDLALVRHFLESPTATESL